MLEIKNVVAVVIFLFLKHWSVWETDRFKLFLHRGINTVHEFLCMRNTICVHVTCTVTS